MRKYTVADRSGYKKHKKETEKKYALIDIQDIFRERNTGNDEQECQQVKVPSPPGFFEPQDQYRHIPQHTEYARPQPEAEELVMRIQTVRIGYHQVMGCISFLQHVCLRPCPISNPG